MNLFIITFLVRDFLSLIHFGFFLQHCRYLNVNNSNKKIITEITQKKKKISLIAQIFQHRIKIQSNIFFLNKNRHINWITIHSTKPNVFQSIIQKILLRFLRFCCITSNDNCVLLLFVISRRKTKKSHFWVRSLRWSIKTNRSAAAYDAFTSFFDGKNWSTD